MSGFIEGLDRGQMTLFPDRLEDWIGENNPVRVIDLFVEETDLAEIGFARTSPAQTGWLGGAALLDQCLSGLPIHGALYHRQRAPDHTMGARSGRRHEPQSCPDDAPSIDCRAPVRHDQGMDGGDTLPDATVDARPH